LPGTLVPPANQLPVPLPLQNIQTKQPPAQSTQPNPPPIPDLPANEPDKKSTTLRIKEPGERFQKVDGAPSFPENAFGDGHWCWTGWRYGPLIAPAWEYPGLGGGPKVIYPFGMPGYTGRNGESSLGKTCRLWGPLVPVYSPVPEPSDTKTLIYPGRNISSPGFIYGWVGPFPASPRYKHYAVNSWAQPGTDLSTGGPNSGANNPGAGSSPATGTDSKKPTGYMTLSVKVPNPSADLFVDGTKTTQTGVERTFRSPELEDGKEFRYELTVRWLDQGVLYEKKKIVIGSSGEVIPLDFTAPEVVRASK
jgi:uncharacterized protein (TIGR03000 family)